MSRGYPKLVREPSATCSTGAATPAGDTARTITRADFYPSSIQETNAPPSLFSAVEAYPSVSPVLTTTGLVNVVPPSEENTNWTLGASPASVYQAMATRSSFAAAEAALTGQALISQLSACRILDVDQRPFSKRITAISRMSLEVWSR